MKRSIRRFAAALLCLAATSVDAAPPRTMAVTVDDLPWSATTALDAARADGHHRRLLDALKKSGAPAVGFVNEDKLERDGAVDPARRQMLADWLDAGFELGNHTYGHVDLHSTPVGDYERAILDGERETRALLAARNATPRWFRHPYLRAGRDAATRTRVEAFLAEHGYRVAPVTLDNSEWIFAAAYRKTADAATKERIAHEYVDYMDAKIAYYEDQSRRIVGREVAQVLLLHANELNADAYGALAARIVERGYAFVTLEEALRDPAYARSDGYFGAYGPSWLHRWAIADKAPKELFAGEPATPRWIMDLAGVTSE
jgi:peptidoglycan/xylan/chitin deacetylase (PgdA/CDA1 family)